MLRRFSGFAVLVGVFLGAAAAQALCIKNVAGLEPGLLRHVALRAQAQVPAGSVAINYVGHSTFLIETAEGVRIATDYNDYVRPRVTPDIVTMNIAHSSHYSRGVEPGVKHALQGWGTVDKPAEHELVYRDVLVRNVPTNLREGEGNTFYNGNSIFVFETAGLCVAHLGHLHHRLTPEHLKQLGDIDILFVPVDGMYTLGQDLMIEVVEQIRAPVVIPMHFFSEGTLWRFVGKVTSTAGLGYEINLRDKPSIVLSRETLPQKREIIVLPGRM